MKIYRYVLVPTYGDKSEILCSGYSWFGVMKQKRKMPEKTTIKRIKL